MRPTEFPQQNAVFAKDQPEYIPLPAYISKDCMEVTSCWKGTWRERFKFLLTGKVYYTQLTFGQRLQPIRASMDPPSVVFVDGKEI